MAWQFMLELLSVRGREMKFRLRKSIFLVGAVMLAISAPASAKAACYVVSRTNDGLSKPTAIAASRASFDAGLQGYKRRRGWRRITSVRARRVRPDPLWKAVRTSVPRSALLPPAVWSRRHYTICWTGVVSPVVCTTGALVCGQ
jgi:hypothetical protein